MASRPLQALSPEIGGGTASVIEQEMPGAIDVDCVTVWPSATFTGVWLGGEAAFCEQCVVVLKLGGIGAEGST
ncbi:MAG: hypothetical protein ABIT61_05565 [Steroidobacteraceae bacterium]